MCYMCVTWLINNPFLTPFSLIIDHFRCKYIVFMQKQTIFKYTNDENGHERPKVVSFYIILQITQYYGFYDLYGLCMIS